MKNFVLIALVGLTSLSAVAQKKSFEDFKREREAKLQQMQDDFNRFVEERDRKFAEYLQGDFRQFRLERSLRPTDSPKPIDFPTYDQAPTDSNRRYQVDTISPSYDERSRGLLIPPSTKEGNEHYTRAATGVQFYGNQLSFRYDPRLRLPHYEHYTAETISQAWLALSHAHVRELINQLYRRKNALSLNDWGFVELVQQLAQGLYGSDDPRAALTTWFLLNKARYKVKLGYYDNRLYLLLPSRNTVYSATYYAFGQERYYLFGDAPESLYTYPDDYAGADQALDMELNSPLNLGGVLQKKTFTFQYAGQTYTLPLEYNPQAMAFYQNYPAVELRAKIEANVSREAKESLLTQLRPLLSKRSEREQVGLLLRFVQTAFAYKMDQDQFGDEKYFFPEEVLHYAYSDCEDRVALFTYLVRQLVKLRVVCLNYPGHVAAAVQFSEDGTGDYVMLRDRKYTICDPTYVNAPVGKSMDRFASVQAEVLSLRDPVRKLKQEAVWAAAASFGGYPASGSHNVVIDRDDNVYFTGYLLAGDSQQGLDMFVAKITAAGNLAWLQKAAGRGNDTGNYIALDAHQDVYVAGRYEQNVRFAESTRLDNDISGFFVAKYSPAGEVRWAQDVPIDVTDNSLQNTFAAKISSEGEVVESALFDGVYAERGVVVDDRGYVYLMGDTPEESVTYSDTRSFDPASGANAVETLAQANDALRAEQYDPAMIGLLAVIRCIRQDGAVLSGAVAQRALDRYNPTFKESSPQIYANIGRLDFMKNQAGIVTIASQDGKPVNFNRLRIDDQARVRVQTFADGNAQMDVLSGVTVGRSVVRFPLNYVRFFRENGDLLFDYDNDHTQAVVNLSRDILY